MHPLEGVRIVAVEHYGSGPWSSMYLADLGAEVIKIENPATGGDIARKVGPHLIDDTDSLFFQTFNRNKRSLCLDLKDPDSRAVFHRLIATADGLVNNLRADQPKKLGLTYDDLKEINPRIVCAHLSAYGRGHERESWPGYDYLMQAEAGFMTLTGEPGSVPVKTGLSLVDWTTGVTTALALVSGILAAGKTGEGRDLEVSLFDTAMHQLTYPATWYLNENDKTERVARSGHPSIVPAQLFTTDDGWIMVMAMTEKFWQVLIDKIARPELGDDPRFTTVAQRNRNRQALCDILDDVLSRRTTEHWLDLFRGTLPVAPVHDLAQALDSPHVAETGLIQEVEHPVYGTLRLVANPIRDNGALLPSRVAPALGQDNEALLRELGFESPEEDTAG